jgi:hypothetical protein
MAGRSLSNPLAYALAGMGRFKRQFPIQLESVTMRIASVETIVKLALAGQSGRNWYSHAASQVEQAAELLNCEAAYFADILAILSPRVSVKRNLRFAVRYVETGQFAPDIMRGIRAGIAHYHATGEIRGPKTAPFAAALKRDYSAIVLDVWMAKAFGIPQAAFSNKGTHAKCCKRIASAAKRLGWQNAEVQAAVWTAIVKASGRKPGQFNLVEISLFGARLAVKAA